jgi:hypothetical protein
MTADIRVSSDKTNAGDELAIDVGFSLKPGWHVYGTPLPANYTPTAVELDPEIAQAPSFDFPKAAPLVLKSLGETLPVYTGDFRAVGRLTVVPDLKPGHYQLQGTLHLSGVQRSGLYGSAGRQLLFAAGNPARRRESQLSTRWVYLSIENLCKPDSLAEQGGFELTVSREADARLKSTGSLAHYSEFHVIVGERHRFSFVPRFAPPASRKVRREFELTALQFAGGWDR